MQAITSLRLLLHCGQLRRVLLICPKPLVTNWQREFDLWAPEIPLNVISGNAEQRKWKWNHPQAVLTLANYELVQRDHTLLQESTADYDLVILDEAQRIKNRKGATACAVRDIPRRRSWALTGTPVENSLEDLVGIFEFVAPGTARRHDATTSDGQNGFRLYVASDQGSGADRFASETRSQRDHRPHSQPTRELSAGRGRWHHPFESIGCPGDRHARL